MVNSELALQFKAEGNALFTNGKYQDAYHKFTAAIGEDDANAIFHANRAACCLHLKKHMDAMRDALKATELDPRYAKAWARLAEANEALGNYPNANIAWRRAIANLPPSLSTVEAEQKRRWEKFIRDNNEKMAPRYPNIHPEDVQRAMQHNMPWQRAIIVCDELTARGGGGGGSRNGMESSAWSILEAHKEFSEAVAHLDRLRAEGPASVTVGALEPLSNSILRDHRCFVINNAQWFDVYNLQVMYEVNQARGWFNAGPEEIISDIQRKVAQVGWSPVKAPLDMTLRAWITHAYMDTNFEDKAQPAVEFFRNVMTIIKRVQTLWPEKDFPSAEDRRSKRGYLFEKEYEICIRSLELESYMQASCNTGDNYPWGALVKMSDELLDLAKDLDTSNQTGFAGIGSGSMGAAVSKAVATAYQAKACCHSRHGQLYQMMAHREGHDEDMPNVLYHFGLSAKFYQDCAEKYPRDDELYSWYLAMSVDMYQRTRGPISKILSLIKNIRSSYSRVTRIWQFSNLALAGRDKVMENLFKYQDKMEEKLRKREIRENDAHFETRNGKFVSLIYDVPDGPMSKK